jgi:predicted RNA-binding protein
MCEANAYMVKEGNEELFLESVNVLEPKEGGKIYLENVLGEQKLFSGRIKEIRLVEHKIILEKIAKPL